MGIGTSEMFNVTLPMIKNNNVQSICMIGKQDLLIEKSQIRYYLERLNLSYDEKKLKKIELDHNKMVDSYDFFKMIGIKEVHALDYSSYEGADIIVNLNSDEIPEKYVEKFDLVYDGGTLEHVIDQLTALKRINSLAKKGGIIYHNLPCVGFVDHGFYSYSPTFFLDYYTKKNGYELESIKYVFYKPSKFDDDSIYSQDIRLIRGDVNAFIDENMHNITNRICTVAVEARKIASITDGIIPIQGTYANVDEHKRGEINYSKLMKVISEKKSIAIYGCGEYSNRIVNEFFKCDYDAKISFYFESDPNVSGKEFRGKKVFYPSSEKVRVVDAIIISSVKYENEMVKELHLANDMEIDDKMIKVSEFIM